MIHRNSFFHGDPSERRGVKVLRIIGMTFVGVIFAAIFALVFGFLVKWLWNAIMPAVFGPGVGTITYWQAFGIVILAKLLFGGHPKGHDNHYSRKHHDKAHEFLGIPHERPWGFGHDAKKWNQFTKYWKEKGRADFENYMNRMNEEQTGESKEEKS
ncbi:MAG: hypothetical protein JXB26_20480 [Candidatus Aminicenantes bacterium]|nr:hypothetical protein [Candidatus Aminicenantes bacterium]